MTTVLSERLVKRCRKPHRCVWCGELVEVGESAIKEISIHDGDFYSYYWHAECHDAIRDSYLESDDRFYPMLQKRGLTFEQIHF